MPFVHHHVPKCEAVVFVGAGLLTDDELLTGANRALGDPNYRADCRIFFDFGGVDEFRVSTQVLENPAVAGIFRAPTGRRAFLMFSPLGSTTLRNAILIAGHQNLKVFSDRRAAYEWLNEGLSPDKILVGGPSSWPFVVPSAPLKSPSRQ